MPRANSEYDSALAQSHAAITDFQVASSVIDARLLTGSPPTPAEWKNEEWTRTRLLLARRRLYSLYRAPWSVAAPSSERPALIE